VAVFAEVDPPAKQKFDALVQATGAPRWAVLQAFLEHVEVDAQGLPVWWDAPRRQQEALEIPA
jgi:hypothetical protein